MMHGQTKIKYLKLFSQTEREMINNCDFSLKFVILLGTAIVVTRSEGQNGKLCIWHQRLATTKRLHLHGSTPKNAKTGAAWPLQ